MQFSAIEYKKPNKKKVLPISRSARPTTMASSNSLAREFDLWSFVLDLWSLISEIDFLSPLRYSNCTEMITTTTTTTTQSPRQINGASGKESDQQKANYRI